jgi:hypothetical protein
MSQKSVTHSFESSLLADASPVKRARYDRKQFIGPSYIRLQVLSFALSLVDLPLTFIDPGNEKSIVRAARDFLDLVYQKAQKKGLLMQSRKNTRFGKMGGAICCCKQCMLSNVRGLDLQRGCIR